MLKKIFVFFIVFASVALSAFADRIPTSSKSIKNYGVGVFKVENDFYVFSAPDSNAKKIKHFLLPSNKEKSAIVRTSKTEAAPYIISIPSQQEYFATVYSYPENNWLELFLSVNSKETGFVKVSQKNIFMTWKEFFYRYGKQNGLVLMKDVPSTQFCLYSQDSEKSQIIEKFTYPEYIAMRMIRGNWMLVTVIDTGAIYKTGWFKWRNDDGKLRLFPKFK